MKIEEEDTCGNHYHVDFEVICCNGIRFACGFNFYGTMQENVDKLRVLFAATAKTQEQRAVVESVFDKLQGAFPQASLKTKKTKKSKPGPKVVPIMPGPFAKS
jgi:hypothetical protein